MNDDHLKFLREHYDFSDPPAYSTSTEEVRKEWYDAYFDVQGGVCAICKCKASERRNLRTGRTTLAGPRFDFDHNGLTDKMRGLLCHSCNMALGKFDHSLYYLQNAIDYLLDKHVEGDGED
jgi:hypothetical protein